MKNIKIALTGKARSGKDTVGKLLIEQGFHRYAFGDEIKQLILKYFPEAFEHGKPRKYYLKIGQTFRELNSDVWINCLMNRIEISLQLNAGLNQALRKKGRKEQPFNIVVTDVRQENEVKALRKQGFKIIKVNCPDEIRIQRMKDLGDVFTLQDLEDETEIQVDSIIADYEINNFSGLQETKRQLKVILQDINNN